MRRLLFAASPFAIVLACSTDYEEDKAIMSPDAGIVDAATEAAPDAPIEDGGAPATTCSAAFAGACVPGSSCTIRRLSVPSTPEVVFEIQTDRDFVYWLAQPDDDTGKGYNGESSAQVRRVAKRGGTTDLLVAAQPGATELVLDGDAIYWTTFSAPGHLEVRRARRDCASPCSSETLAALENAGKTESLLRLGPGVLAIQTKNGIVRRFDTTTKRFDELGITDNLPAITATRDTIVTGAGTMTKLFRASFDPSARLSPFADLPAVADASALYPGVFRLATDCTSLFAIRNDDTIWRGPLATGALTPFAPGKKGTYGLAVDARYVYSAVANAGGLIATDLTTGTSTTIAGGNIWFVAVDDAGVYWGDHARSTGGAVDVMEK